MTKKKRTASQTRWLKEHFDDVYVQEAHKKAVEVSAFVCTQNGAMPTLSPELLG